MGMRNRAKRAAKKRARRQRGPTAPRWSAGGVGGDSPHGPGRTYASDESSAPPPPPGAEEIAGLLHDAARAESYRSVGAAEACALKLTSGAFTRWERVVGNAAGIALASVVDRVWHEGWMPVDIWEFARRRTDTLAIDLLVDAIASDVAQHAPATVHERWAAQVEQLEAVPWWERDRPHLQQWADRHGLDIEEALVVTIGLLAHLMTVPRLPQIVPPPGAQRGVTASAAGVDQKVLARVRALLAKAESTDFPEEAEALSAKAQELMNRHAFERAMLDADAHKQQHATSIRLWLDSPYVDAKSQLVTAIAKANRCKTVFYSKLGFVALVGEELDLEITELLTTSLQVQATRAMVAEGSRQFGGTSRTRSFRRAFLFSYAVRIGERLTEAGARAHEPLEDERLLPVLADRSRVVEETFEAMFPETFRRKSVSVSNGEGWQAGRAAADRADLDIDRRAVSA